MSLSKSPSQNKLVLLCFLWRLIYHLWNDIKSCFILTQSRFANRQNELVTLLKFLENSLQLSVYSSIRSLLKKNTKIQMRKIISGKGNTPNMACKSSFLLQQTPAVHSDWCRRLKHSAPQTALGNQFVMMLHCKFVPIQIQLSVYDDTLCNSLLQWMNWIHPPLRLDLHWSI
jgi:hypothetical protein